MGVELRGAVACVTGGARGIGRATASAMAEAGAVVWIGDVDPQAAGEAASALGPSVRAAHVDVTDADSFKRFLANVEESSGPPDVLVNNAGIMPTGNFLDMDTEADARTIGVNLSGVINGTRLALPGMIERRRGHIANVSSLMAKVPLPGVAVYTATKYAVLGLTNAIRQELESDEVTLSTVLPSAVRTELITGIPLPPGMPIVDPEDVAEAIVASCANGRREVHVPRWAGAIDIVDAAVPATVMDGVRRLFDDRRALERVDQAERAAYENRVTGRDAGD